MTRCEMHFVLDHGNLKIQKWSNRELKGGHKRNFAFRVIGDERERGSKSR